MILVEFHNHVTDRQFKTYDELFDHIRGELGPALRHLERIKENALPVSPQVVDEIAASVNRTVLSLAQTLVVAVDVNQSDRQGPYEVWRNGVLLYRGDNGMDAHSAIETRPIMGPWPPAEVKNLDDWQENWLCGTHEGSKVWILEWNRSEGSISWTFSKEAAAAEVPTWLHEELMAYYTPFRKHRLYHGNMALGEITRPKRIRLVAPKPPKK